MPNRRQAIIWTNAGLIHWRIYTALGGDELIKSCIIYILPGTKLLITHYLITHYPGFSVLYEMNYDSDDGEDDNSNDNKFRHINWNIGRYDANKNWK